MRSAAFRASPSRPLEPGDVGDPASACILIVEDDVAIRDVLAHHLERAGHSVVAAGDGVSGLSCAREQSPDLVIVDLMLPRMSGTDLIRQLRHESDIAVLILSARGELADRVAGLEQGADDFLAKPFSIHEVLARVRALLRRARRGGALTTAAEPSSEAISVDDRAHEVRRNGELIALTPREFALLSFLVRHPRQAFSRDALLDRVWGHDYTGDTRTVDVHMYWLRRKLEADPAHPRHLLTVRRVGYRYAPSPGPSIEPADGDVPFER